MFKRTWNGNMALGDWNEGREHYLKPSFQLKLFFGIGVCNVMTFAEKSVLLTASRLPARLNNEQVAVLLGMAEHDIPVLVKRKLLKTLGNPIRNTVKHYAGVEIEALRSDVKWLAKATNALRRGHITTMILDWADASEAVAETTG
jgi:hypothetical protein